MGLSANSGENLTHNLQIKQRFQMRMLPLALAITFIFTFDAYQSASQSQPLSVEDGQVRAQSGLLQRIKQYHKWYSRHCDHQPGSHCCGRVAGAKVCR